MFQIEFPATLSKKTIDALRTILPDPNIEDEQYDDPMDVEEHFLVEINNDQNHYKYGNGGDAIMNDRYYDTDDDDENMNGQQNVQCQQS